MLRFLSKVTLFVFLLCAGLFSFKGANAQKVEVGMLLGGSYYYGDIVNDLDLTTIRYSAGGFIRYHMTDRWVIKGFGGYCRVEGADSNSSSQFQKNRNLSFFTDIFEGSVQLEYNLVEDRFRGRRILHRYIPYLFVGAGGFYFVPQAYYTDGTPVNLAQIRTEGKVYEQFAACVPFGAGVRAYVTRNFQIGLELGIRYTSTSYIDDVGGDKARYPSLELLFSQSLYPGTAYVMYDRSKLPKSADTGYGYGYPGKQRGKIAINDLYVIGGLTLSYRFGSSGGGGFGGGRAIRCPRFY